MIKKMVRGAMVGLAATFSAAMAAAPATPTPDNLPAIKNAVADCVEETHKAGFANFDAFYNPASNKTENNVTYVADQGAIFIFDKCMAARGYPIVYGQ